MVFLLASTNAKLRSRFVLLRLKIIANLERFSELITFPHHRLRDFYFINLNLLAQDCVCEMYKHTPRVAQIIEKARQTIKNILFCLSPT